MWNGGLTHQLKHYQIPTSVSLEWHEYTTKEFLEFMQYWNLILIASFINVLKVSENFRPPDF